MDADLVVQYVTRSLLLLGGALAFGLFATWLVGRLCRRAAVSPGLTLVAQLLTPVALLYAASLYLDVAGYVAQARVASTEEEISYPSGSPSIPGNWSRSFWATVKFNAPDGPREAPLWIDEKTFDALRPGAAITVRYLPWLPFIARPAEQSTLAFVPWRWLAIGFLVVGVALALRRLLRPAPPWVKALLVLSSIGAVVVTLVFPTPWLTPLDPPVLTTIAEVRQVREVTRSFVSGRTTGFVPAPQPWNPVELRFVPQGRDTPVIAVDGVDIGSVPGLQSGARVPVSYNASNPRDARLAGARSYRWREWGELAELALAAVVVTGGFLLLGKAAGAWWRRMLNRA
jgi:hypothetical protein